MKYVAMSLGVLAVVAVGCVTSEQINVDSGVTPVSTGNHIIKAWITAGAPNN